MSAEWVVKYLGIPWRDHGRSHTGCDCWGLVRLVLEIEARRTLPSFEGLYDTADSVEELDALFDQAWPLPGIVPVTGNPQEFDILLFRVCGSSCHVAVALGDGRFLHVRPDCYPAVESLANPMWKPRLMGVYRHE